MDRFDEMALDALHPVKSAQYASWRESVAAALRTVAQEERRKALEEGYDAGFRASGEGWNGEYPGDAESFESWHRTKAEAIRALIDQPTGETKEWTCPRCKQAMDDSDCAEGCEDHDCPTPSTGEDQ